MEQEREMPEHISKRNFTIGLVSLSIASDLGATTARAERENDMFEAASVETFPAMLRRVLGNRLRPGAETFLDMFAADGVLEYPFAPPGLISPLIGKDAIIANFGRIGKFFRVDQVVEVTEIKVSDPNLVVIEFFGRGESPIMKEAYDQRYISLISMRDGYIAHYKDYWNPFAFLRAVKGSAAMSTFKMD